MGRKNGRVYERRGAVQWERLIAAQAAGALSQRAFCEQRGLSYASFCNWKRRLREESEQAATAGGFIELDVSPASREHWDVELTLGEGVVLRVRRG